MPDMHIYMNGKVCICQAVRCGDKTKGGHI